MPNMSYPLDSEMKTLDDTKVNPTAYGNAVKQWVKGGKKYPLDSYLVTECDCGCTQREVN